MPVYRKLDAEYRKVDPDYILFFKNMPFPDHLPLMGGLILRRFTERVNPDKLNNEVYNVHNYCCLSGPTVCSDPEPGLEYSKSQCPEYHKRKFAQNIRDAKNINVPLILTEFGACYNNEACYNEILGFVKGA